MNLSANLCDCPIKFNLEGSAVVKRKAEVLMVSLGKFISCRTEGPGVGLVLEEGVILVRHCALVCPFKLVVNIGYLE